MLCRTNNPAYRRYLRRFTWSMAYYVATLTLSVTVFLHQRPTGPLAWALAVLPALGIVGTVAAFALYLKEETDEFQRAVAVHSILWATGATLSVTAMWGFLEDFVHAAHLDPIWVFPMFCAFWGLATPLVMRRYR
jgi:uncharacterized membrane protein